MILCSSDWNVFDLCGKPRTITGWGVSDVIYHLLRNLQKGRKQAVMCSNSATSSSLANLTAILSIAVSTSLLLESNCFTVAKLSGWPSSEVVSLKQFSKALWRSSTAELSAAGRNKNLHRHTRTCMDKGFGFCGGERDYLKSMYIVLLIEWV